MAKRLTVRTGEYQKNGETKGEYTSIGVMLSSDNGEFILLDPAINHAVLLNMQNQLNRAKGKPHSNKLMVSIFDDSQQNNPSLQSSQQSTPADAYDDVF